MNWFTLALISSITLSLREFFVKRIGKQMPSAFLSWGLNFFMFLIFLLLNFVYSNPHMVSASFVRVLILAAILDSCATLLYLSAIKNGDLSKIIPMLCFIPAVQLFVTPVLVHETLTLTGIAGVLVVVAGSYVLNVQALDRIFSPITAVLRDKNAMKMLAVACLWGVSSSFHKIGVKETGSLFWGMCEMGLITLFLFPMAVRSGKKQFTAMNFKKIFWPAVLSCLTVLSYYAAIRIGPVAYVSSVRRLGVLFSMLIGIAVFKETIKPHSFAGGLIMIAGAVVISLFG